MKFSTGFFDGIFGKKTTLQVPQDDGTTREVPVTEAWLKKMQAEGMDELLERSVKDKDERIAMFVSQLFARLHGLGHTAPREIS